MAAWCARLFPVRRAVEGVVGAGDGGAVPDLVRQLAVEGAVGGVASRG